MPRSRRIALIARQRPVILFEPVAFFVRAGQLLVNVKCLSQMLSQRCRCRMVEDNGGRQLQTGHRFQPIPKLDRTERIETQLLELLVRSHGVVGVVSEHRGRIDRTILSNSCSR